MVFEDNAVFQGTVNGHLKYFIILLVMYQHTCHLTPIRLQFFQAPKDGGYLPPVHEDGGQNLQRLTEENALLIALLLESTIVIIQVSQDPEAAKIAKQAKEDQLFNWQIYIFVLMHTFTPDSKSFPRESNIFSSRQMKLVSL